VARLGAGKSVNVRSMSLPTPITGPLNHVGHTRVRFLAIAAGLLLAGLLRAGTFERANIVINDWRQPDRRFGALGFLALIRRRQRPKGGFPRGNLIRTISDLSVKKLKEQVRHARSGTRPGLFGLVPNPQFCTDEMMDLIREDVGADLGVKMTVLFGEIPL